MDPNQKNKKADASAEIQQNLKKTEMGQFLQNNLKLVIGVGIIVIAVLIAMPIYNNLQKENNLKLAGKIFELNQKLEKFEKDEIKFEEMQSSVKEFENENGVNKFTAMTFVDVAKAYQKKGKAKEALELLDNKSGEFSTKPYISFFYNQLLAVLHEEQGNVDNAINSLEKIISHNKNILDNQIYFDLGRLYLQKKDQSKASEKLKFVVENTEKSEQLYKIANLLLKRIESK